VSTETNRSAVYDVQYRRYYCNLCLFYLSVDADGNPVPHRSSEDCYWTRAKHNSANRMLRWFGWAR
jgi:hypothetical protein